MRYKRVIALLLATAATLAATSPAHSQTAPLYVVEIQNELNSSLAGPNGNLAANKNGDVFVPNAGNNVVLEYPSNGGTPITIFTSTTGSQVSGVAVDFNNNLYVTTRYDGSVSATDSDIFEFPYSEGAYPGPYTYDGTAPGACTATSIGVCTWGQYYAIIGYYQPQAIAFDGHGNGYMVTTYGGTNGSGMTIYQCNVQCGYDLAYATILANIPTQATSIAANAAGDVYYSDGSSVYVVYAGTSTAVLFDGSLAVGGSGAEGVGFDRAGNLYVNVNQGGAPYDDGDYEYPLINGKITASSKFLLDNIYGYTGPTVDSHGNLYTAQYGVLYQVLLYNGSFPSTSIGTASSPLTFTVLFDAAGTVASLKAYQGSAPATEFAISSDGCTGNSQGARGTCTFNVTFTPSALGVRNGAVVLTDTSGNHVTTYLSGYGAGTGITVDPGTPVAIGSTFTTPTGIAVDNAGNVYVADAGAKTVSEFLGGAGAAVPVGSGYTKPTGVAVDNTGDVFVADNGAGAVYEVPIVNGVLSTATPTTVISGLTNPTDVFIDGIGELYVSVTGSNEIFQYPNLTRYASSAMSSALGVGLSGPTGVAVDTSGNLYVADTGNDRVLELAPNGGQTTVGSALSAPTGVSVEPSGSVIIADQGNFRLLRVPNEAGVLNASDQIALPQPVLDPYAVRMSSAGNLYITDNVNASADELERTVGTLSFSPENLNTASGPESILLSSIGSANLTLGSPLYPAVPATSGFTVSSGTSSSACSGGTLSTGYDCSLSATFDPTATGTDTYPLTFAVTANNVTNPTLTLTGQGVQLSGVTVTLAQTSPTGPASYGVPIVIQATVASSGTGTATPTGDVVFTVNGQQTTAFVLAGGTATLTLTGLSAGADTVQASYGGDSNYASGTSSVLSFTVAQATVVATETVTADAADPYSSAPGDPVGITVTLTPVVAGTFSGTVTFTNGTTVLGSAAVYQNANGTYGASFSSTTLANGVYNIVATYSGNANYAPVALPAVQITVVGPSYTVTASSGTITASPSQPGTTTLTVTSYSDFQGGVDFACSGLPVNAYCVFTPGSASLINTAGSAPAQVPVQQISMQVLVDENPTTVKSAGFLGMLGLFSGMGLLLAFWKNRTWRQISFGCVLAVLGAIGLGSINGCGAGSSATPYGTPVGTYNVTVTSTATPLQSNGEAPTQFGIASIVSAPLTTVPSTCPTTSSLANTEQVALTATTSISGTFTSTSTGNPVTVLGVTPSSFNGTYILTCVDDTTNTMYFASTLGNLTGSGGYVRDGTAATLNYTPPTPNTFTLTVLK